MTLRMIPTAFAVLAFTSLAALASDTVTTGVIKSIDAAGASVTLTDGGTYVLPKGFDPATLKPGEKVTISWSMSGTRHMADEVKQAS